jgi:hypothetical protein
MEPTGVRALPRNVDDLGWALDLREFWEAFGLSLRLVCDWVQGSMMEGVNKLQWWPGIY